MQSERIGKIGMILTGLSPVAALLWWYSAGIVFLMWYLSYQITYMTFGVLMVGLSIVMTIVGLTMYIAGRRMSWQANKKQRAVLLIIGIGLVAAGSILVWYMYAMSVYGSLKYGHLQARSLDYYLAENSPYFVLSAFWVASGVTLLIDAVLGKPKLST